MKDKDIFTLKEIAGWQLNKESSNVELPVIQRGFVWKPKQVEDLWDSILRGYPIGSFLFTRTEDKLYLMDGQQRATSIFLGHYYPDNLNPQAWSIKGELPILWLDLLPKSLPLNSKYLFRLTTRSHPWGYQAEKNDRKLSVSDRSKALYLFQKNPNNQSVGYTSFKNHTIFPYDCSFPVPFQFLLNSISVEELVELIEKNIPDYICTKHGGFKNKSEFIQLIRTTLFETTSKIIETVESIKNLDVKSNILDNRVLEEETVSDEPTLFVRINSAGTALSGDDLIYSIYKATFPRSKQLIEEIGINFISPTQVLSLISRIVTSSINSNKYSNKLNVRDFQRKIKEETFKNSINDLVENGTFKNLFKLAIDILSGKESDLVEEIPPVIVKQFIKDNQTLFYFLLYWLFINAPNGELIDKSLRLKALSKLYYFKWFSNGLKVESFWEKEIENSNFWFEPINRFCQDNLSLIVIFPPDVICNYLTSRQVFERFRDNDRNKWDLIVDNEDKSLVNYFKRIINHEEVEYQFVNRKLSLVCDRIRFIRQLVLFAQRKYINSEFSDYNQLDAIEDTNAPWDWDHIYPDSWVYNKKKCPQLIRDWNNSIGNFRAISLQQNRSESNSLSPSERLENEEYRCISFVFPNDWEFWSKIEGRIDWVDDELEYYYCAVVNRLMNIYRKVWSDFKFNELFQ